MLGTLNRTAAWGLSSVEGLESLEHCPVSPLKVVCDLAQLKGIFCFMETSLLVFVRTPLFSVEGNLPQTTVQRKEMY